MTLLVLMIFWTFKSEIQPWYFMILFGLLPFYEDFVFRLNILFFGFLMSYYPYVRHGGWVTSFWTTDQKVIFKHNVIIVFFVINLAYLFYIYFLRKKLQIKRS